jgi:hypothetical protein
VLGAVLGGIVVWFAGAVLDWQRDLSFTFGVTRRLLPFGDQLGLLRDIQIRWWLVIIGAALGVAFVAAAFGALLGGILAAAYNRSPRHALVVVELPSRIVAEAGPVPHEAWEAAGTLANQPAPGHEDLAVSAGHRDVPREAPRPTTGRGSVPSRSP